ncbi:MAG: IclR family transcriptional regulator [Ruegeria sp.]
MATQKRPRGRPKSLFKESSAGTMQSLDRALGVLTSVARLERASLSELSREVGVPTATTHRILVTLQKHGFVSFNTERQEWMIGVEAYRTGASFLRHNSVVEIGRSVLRRLMLDSGETANLAVPDGSEVVFVGQVETSNPIRAFFPPGARTPMYASGTGKAILAAMDEANRKKVLDGAELEQFTPNTCATLPGLLKDLEDTRTRGWSYDREERHAGMSCIGAAIFNDKGEPCAGVSVSGPSARFHSERATDLATCVVNVAEEITRLSGGNWQGYLDRSDG